MLTRRIFSLACFLTVPVALHAQTRYTVTNLGNVGGTLTWAYGINTSGVVVGEDSVLGQTSKPFVYSGGSITELPSLVTGQNAARGINASGTIVGTSIALPAGTLRAFRISGGSMTDLGAGAAYAINDAGTIVGISGNSAASYSNGTWTPLGTLAGAPTGQATAINASGMIAGYVDAASGRRAFRYANGTMADLGSLGGLNNYAWGINAAGVVVGSSNPTSAFTLRACIYSGGSVTEIHLPGEIASQAEAINASGTVVGSAETGATRRAFIYTPATGVVDLNTLVVNLAAAGFTRLTEGMAINDAGQIAGRGLLANGRFGAFWADISTIPAAPTIAVNPQAQVTAPGGTVIFSVNATSTGLTYGWRFNGNPIAGATGSTFTIAGATAANAGNYSVVVTNAGGSATSLPAALTVTPGVAGRLINLSILTSLAAAGETLTMGYVVGGAGTTGSKPLVIRAAGPTLAAAPFGVGGALTDPKMELYVGSTRTGENDNWGGGGELTNAMAAVGAFAFSGTTSRDAAAFATIAPGNNSVIVSGVGNITGTVLAELYEATPSASFSPTTARLVNVSVLKNIGAGLTVGFVVGGSASTTVLVRAIGPTLGAAPFNVSGVVVDPQLALFSGQTRIVENNDWGGTPALTAAFAQVGAFALPAASRDSAVLVTLAPGNYTAQVSGVGNTNGTALVEVYEVP